MATKKDSKSPCPTEAEVLEATGALAAAKAARDTTEARNHSPADLSLDAQSASTVREMLLIGLASWGELGRIGDELDALRTCGRAVPEGVRPILPDGSNDTVCRFAEALRALVPVGQA